MSAQLSRDDWKGRVGGLSYRNQAFIGGKFTPSLTGKTFDCINPATGQVLTKVAACEQADVDAAVKAARAAVTAASTSGCSQAATWVSTCPVAGLTQLKVLPVREGANLPPMKAWLR